MEMFLPALISGFKASIFICHLYVYTDIVLHSPNADKNIFFIFILFHFHFLGTKIRVQLLKEVLQPLVAV